MRDTAITAARTAGALIQEHYGTLLTVDEVKRNDIKLAVDKLCEKAIVTLIRERFPTHAILAEEGGGYPGEGDYTWIIDPLDGTVNFYYGLPYFCTSIACYQKPSAANQELTGLPALGTPEVGAIYAPLQDEMFVGVAGGEATLNANPIQVSGVDDLTAACLITGLGNMHDGKNLQLEAVGRVMESVRKVRCFGAVAYDLCQVACGRATGVFHLNLRAWDIAAARIIVEAAGGIFAATELADNDWRVTVSAPGIHEELKRLAWGS